MPAFKNAATGYDLSLIASWLYDPGSGFVAAVALPGAADDVTIVASTALACFWPVGMGTVTYNSWTVATTATFAPIIHQGVKIIAGNSPVSATVTNSSNKGLTCYGEFVSLGGFDCITGTFTFDVVDPATGTAAACGISFDTAAAAAPLTTRWAFRVGTANNASVTLVTRGRGANVNGLVSGATYVQMGTVLQAGQPQSNNAYYATFSGQAANQQTGRYDCQWTKFTNVGGTGAPGFVSALNAAQSAGFTDCLFDGCDRYQFTLNTTASLWFRRCSVFNSPTARGTSFIQEQSVAQATGGAVRELIDCVFDRAWSLNSRWTTISNTSLVSYQTVGSAYQATATSGWTLWDTGHVFVDGTGQCPLVYNDPIQNVGLIKYYSGDVLGTPANPVNPTGFLTYGNAAARTAGLTRCDAECVTNDNQGDIFHFSGNIPSGSARQVVDTGGSFCIVLPNANGNSSGTTLTCQADGTRCILSLDHNTGICEGGIYGITFAEGVNGTSDVFDTCRGNLMWNGLGGLSANQATMSNQNNAANGVANYWGGGIGALKVSDNATWGFATGYRGNAASYPGDVGNGDLSNVDPQWRSSHACAANYYAYVKGLTPITVGLAGDKANRQQYTYNFRDEVLKRNTSAYDVRFERATYRLWLEKQLAPQNAIYLYNPCRSDGKTRGAVAYDPSRLRNRRRRRAA